MTPPEQGLGEKISRPARRMIPDKYLAFLAWFILLITYCVFALTGHESRVIESMLSTAFGALAMALQAGFRRMDDAAAAKREPK